MRVMIVDKPHEVFASIALQEMSKNEHHGIKNMLILAISGNDEPMLMSMNASDLYSLEAMLSYGTAYFNFKEILFDKALMEDLMNDEIPEVDE